MTLPITVTFRGMPPRDWIEAEIVKRAGKLGTYADIMSCHVTVVVPHHRHTGGNRFTVHIDLRVPGGEIAVTRDSNLHASEKKLQAESWAKAFDIEAQRKHVGLVIREAFDVARRRLQDFARKRRGAVKVHPRSSRRQPAKRSIRG